MGDLTSTAVVKLTVEVSGLGNWSENCTAAQIRDQAMQGAISKLSKHLHSGSSGFKVVGEPVVTIIQTVARK